MPVVPINLTLGVFDMSATAAVVDLKLSPIAKAEPIVGQQFTAQAALNLFERFTTVVNSEAGAVTKVIIAVMVQARNATVEDFGLATKSVVESTRLTVDNKRIDTTATPLARKFQSMTRAIWGAIRSGYLSLDEAQSFTNSQELYDVARGVLADAKIDWKGLSDAEKEQKAAKRDLKKAMAEVADEETDGDILTLTPEQFTALKGKAAKKLAEKQAQAKLESMEKRAEKIAKDLVASYGLDEAEHVLKMALEKLVQGVFAAA